MYFTEVEAVDLGKRIKELRKNRKLAQGELAAQIGINANHMSRLERGRYQPSVEVLKKIAVALDVSVDALLSDSLTDGFSVSTQNTPVAQRIRLSETLGEDDQRVLVHIIDCMLTKERMRQLLAEAPTAIENMQSAR